MDIFTAAQNANVTAVVWYSKQSAWCKLQGYTGNYGWVYTMTSVGDTQRMLDNINTLSGDNSGSGGGVYLSIGPPDSMNQVSNGTTSGSSSSGGGSSSSQQSSKGTGLGPAPSTAVAMIILYSITGIITALFLVIIATGAIRAHRHPERYGPRNVMGGPRQSRARGLARAMLESLPIVKVGARVEPKPTDVELADAATGEHSDARTTIGAQDVSAGALENGPPAYAETSEQSRPPTEGGIAAASHGDLTRSLTTEEDTQGCSICTEDFEAGQDQRVLPCNHRFHPACIDPWLLNVSGTCPLCRIDLRPQNSRTSASSEVDETGNPIPRDEAMAPPLNSGRTSVRRSIMLGLMGIRRPDRMTREERVMALRQYRRQQSARRRQEQEEGVAETSEEESGLRTRLRNVFRVRTRRTGVEEARQASDEAAE